MTEDEEDEKKAQDIVLAFRARASEMMKELHYSQFLLTPGRLETLNILPLEKSYVLTEEEFVKAIAIALASGYELRLGEITQSMKMSPDPGGTVQ